jgi:hypothetical protein
MDKQSFDTAYLALLLTNTQFLTAFDEYHFVCVPRTHTQPTFPDFQDFYSEAVKNIVSKGFSLKKTVQDQTPKRIHIHYFTEYFIDIFIDDIEYDENNVERIRLEENTIKIIESAVIQNGINIEFCKTYKIPTQSMILASDIEKNELILPHFVSVELKIKKNMIRSKDVLFDTLSLIYGDKNNGLMSRNVWSAIYNVLIPHENFAPYIPHIIVERPSNYSLLQIQDLQHTELNENKLVYKECVLRNSNNPNKNYSISDTKFVVYSSIPEKPCFIYIHPVYGTFVLRPKQFSIDVYVWKIWCLNPKIMTTYNHCILQAQQVSEKNFVIEDVVSLNNYFFQNETLMERLSKFRNEFRTYCKECVGSNIQLDVINPVVINTAHDFYSNVQNILVSPSTKLRVIVVKLNTSIVAYQIPTFLWYDTKEEGEISLDVYVIPSQNKSKHVDLCLKSGDQFQCIFIEFPFTQPPFKYYTFKMTFEHGKGLQFELQPSPLIVTTTTSMEEFDRRKRSLMPQQEMIPTKLVLEGKSLQLFATFLNHYEKTLSLINNRFLNTFDDIVKFIENNSGEVTKEYFTFIFSKNYNPILQSIFSSLNMSLFQIDDKELKSRFKNISTSIFNKYTSIDVTLPSFVDSLGLIRLTIKFITPIEEEIQNFDLLDDYVNEQQPFIDESHFQPPPSSSSLNNAIPPSFQLYQPSKITTKKYTPRIYNLLDMTVQFPQNALLPPPTTLSEENINQPIEEEIKPISIYPQTKNSLNQVYINGILNCFRVGTGCVNQSFIFSILFCISQTFRQSLPKIQENVIKKIFSSLYQSFKITNSNKMALLLDPKGLDESFTHIFSNLFDVHIKVYSIDPQSTKMFLISDSNIIDEKIINSIGYQTFNKIKKKAQQEQHTIHICKLTVDDIVCFEPIIIYNTDSFQTAF